MNQLQIHKKIDGFFKVGIASASIKVALELITFNEDAKRYFFTKADETWLRWIWENNLLDALKKKSEDPTKYGYRLSELEYLTRMVEKEPQLVTDIICSVSISKDTFNPEVVDRFFWIVGLLPVEQVKTLLPKILKENWVQLMAPFNRSGYEYKKIVEKFIEAKDSEGLLELSKIILTLRTKEELDAMEGFSSSGKLFYLHDITETGIFEALLSPENTGKERILKVILEIVAKVVTLGKDRDDVFAESEPFYLLDVDLFTMELNSSRRSYTKDDIENLIAVAKKLTENLFTLTCDNKAEAKRLYATYIATLPDSRTLYRLKLFAITRCPSFFKEEIKEALFRVFHAGERYFEIEGGAEYHHAIISSFDSLDEQTKREYVAKIFEYFGATLGDEDKEIWRKRDGLKILIYIKLHTKGSLTEPEIVKAEEIFGKFPIGDIPEPHPDVIGGESGMISHRSPFNLSGYSIPQIIEHLKTDWSPKVLSEQFKGDHFLSPRGVEGLGDALKDDLKIRITEYFANLNGFFEREFIHPNYVYSLLRGMEELLRDNKTLSNEQYVLLIAFFDTIRLSGEAKEFEKSDEKSWLGDWITVHKIIADVLLNILGDIKDSDVFKKNREAILGIIKYLLSIKNSPDAEDDKREAGEPSHVAINSVRGQAFRAFVQFTYNEGNKTLSKEVRELYEHVLDTDSSNAVRFTIGQFFASFYFRDIPFIKSLLPKIFPKAELGKEKLYFATWEGYLASSLYKELFDELQGYYKYAITLNPSDYPERKYLKRLDETLAGHFALAYAHFDFKIGDPLFDLFWETPNETRHYEFVSFIGRTCITRSQAGDDWFKENKVSKEKLIEFWNWIISTDISIEPKAFSGFGFWVNPDKEIIDEKIIVNNLAIALEKSEGNIDWDYGITRRLKTFAEIDPTNTLQIIKNFLLLDGELNPNRRSPLFSLENEVKEALIIIYKEPTLKKPVEDLVNTLVEKGSTPFWSLIDVVQS